MLFFFFQAEDGIRDIGVTGVQTCALPISPPGGCGRSTIAATMRLVVASLFACWVKTAGANAPEPVAASTPPTSAPNAGFDSSISAPSPPNVVLALAVFVPA